MRKPRLKVGMLRRLLRHIEAEPRRFYMGKWVGHGQARCGTQACLGGWAVILDKGNTDTVRQKLREAYRSSSYFILHGRRALGLTKLEAACLFFTYTSEGGRRGIRRAKAKIDLLIKDREAFVEKYVHLV